MAREVDTYQSIDDSSVIPQRPQPVNLFVAYGLATILFSLGFGVAIAEWYLRSRGEPTVFIRVNNNRRYILQASEER